ncbi:MAG: FkbM family methyltransferase [Omnitrophica bacterium]|nr:FkbM family methyltransferase [Candidatus Omnitrophota bacterium]
MTVIDIGSRGGLKGFKNVKCFSFDYPKILFEDEREVDFYITKDPQNSSILTPNYELLKQFMNTDRFDITDKVRVKTKTLDSYNIKADFIKIDTQGTELSILKGAKETLKNVAGIEIEVCFSPLYKGQALFRDIDKFLEDFELFGLYPYWWKRNNYGCKGQIMFADAVYFSKSRKSIPLLLKYKHDDYAFSLGAKINKFYMPYFKGKGRLALMFKKLYELFRCSENGVYK